MQDVADAVGILKGSLYYYINSKEDLLFRMLLEVHEDAKGIVTETAILDLPPLERLRTYVRRHVVYNARNLAKIAVYYHDFRLLTPTRKQAILEHRKFYENVRGLITEAQERGELDPRIDVSIASNAIFGMMNWIYTWYRLGGKVTPEYLGDLYAEIAVSGITGQQMPEPTAAPKPRGSSRTKGRPPFHG